jgi:hypothetical protein
MDGTWFCFLGPVVVEESPDKGSMGPSLTILEL